MTAELKEVDTTWTAKRQPAIQKRFERDTQNDEAWKTLKAEGDADKIAAFKATWLTNVKVKTGYSCTSRRHETSEEEDWKKTEWLTENQLVLHYGKEADAEKHKESVTEQVSLLVFLST
eukprot:6490941-Amphidinium_carterae.3